MVTIDQIQAAKNKIYRQIATQCNEGRQNANLPDDDLSSCGQFFGENAGSLEQSGIWGTASAMRVLSRANHDVELIAKLFGYLQRRFDSELRNTDQQSYDKIIKPNKQDDNDILKISEILYSIHFLPPVINVEPFKSNLAQKLLAGRINNAGWSHYSNEMVENPPLLPTAYALIALLTNGYNQEVEPQVEYLRGKLIEFSRKESSIQQADISVYIVCLYVLIICGTNSVKEREQLKNELLLPMWRTLERLFGENLEQNLEYWHGDKTWYFRVPWQIYFMNISIHLAPIRVFGTSIIQNRIMSIIRDVEGSGFKYPHSGTMLSTRSNAVLYDFLDNLEMAQISALPIKIYSAIDYARNLLSSRTGIFIGYLSSFLLILFSLWQWFNNGANWGDIAPEILGAILIALFNSKKTR